MKNAIKNNRMTWIARVILLLAIISLSIVLNETLREEYLKQREIQVLTLGKIT